MVAATFRSQSVRKNVTVPLTSTDPPPERMRDIADQLRLLTFRVSADVSAHTEAVGCLTDKLQVPTVEEPERLVSTIEELITANRKMQNQLAAARRRIADQSEMIEHTSVQARTDALTGLANRRALDEFLTNCLATMREGDSVALLLLDIDHFKRVNDDLGHTAGDAVLAAFGRRIKEACGQSGFAGRYGGEEFALILTGYSMIDIVQRAAAIREKLAEKLIEHDDLQLRVTASAGLCELKPTDSVHGVYDRADSGLYRAKESGRNTGYWLHIDQWRPFPDVPAIENKTAGKRSTRVTRTIDEISSLSDVEDHPDQDSPTDRSRAKPTSEANQRTSYRERIEAAMAANANGRSAEFLDLGTFMERLENYLTQLRRANLPATAVMIQAVGIEELGNARARASWKAVLGILQSQMRGIDVACHFKQSCSCMLMPGCALELAVERCSKIQAGLEQARAFWEPLEDCPTRLAIAIATASADEEPASFLHRLEETLEEAEHVDTHEIVIHDGKSIQVQRLV